MYNIQCSEYIYNKMHNWAGGLLFEFLDNKN